MAVSYSHLASGFHISRDSRAQVLFPGHNEIPEGSYGYVRTTTVVPLSWRSETGNLKPVPFRDYPDAVRTAISKLFPTPYQKSRVVVSARNVLNEWPYQARIGDHWFRRHGDPDVPNYFPVLTVGTSGLAVCSFGRAPHDVDILTGLPLVIDQQSMDRDFLIATSSDVTHSYECHPKGLFGPKAPAWQEISDKWHSEWQNWLRDQTYVETKRTRKIDEVAAKFTGWPRSHRIGANLSHSVVIDTGDHNIYMMVLTGTLWSIAAYVQNRGALNAFVLDQSGSVNYCYLEKSANAPKSIVSTTNWRDRGTCFLAVESGGYVPQVQHMWMRQGSGI